jgi:tRNA A-37 threonylcarbamoyl transferase component Bud32
MESLKGLRVAGGEPVSDQTTANPPTKPPSSVDTTSEPIGSKAEPTQELYDFLAPARGPGELGWLGAHRVLRVLGAGGMGVVFLAEDPELKRRVVLKVMKPTLAASATARQRFLREARAMAAVQHDHIVHINQIGQQGSFPFLAMPYLDGETLEDRLQRQNRLPLAEVLRIGREIAEGLAAAHKRGPIHRDIKPANIWLENTGEPGALAPGGRVKILDFGLARVVDDEARLTQSGAIAGTPAYMAPEQVQGEGVDFRCDLFSLGCVLYRLATGKAPFKGRSTLEVLRALELDQPQSPRESNPEMSPALCELVLRLLAKKPHDRPASAHEVAEALRAIEQAPAPMHCSVPPTKGPGPKAASGGAVGRRVLVAAAVLALALVPLSYFFGGTVIRFATNKGELIIEPDDPNIEVTIKGDSATIYDSVKDRRFVLTAGDYEVQVREVGDGGARFATRKFTITRGGKETLNARLTLAKAKPKKPRRRPVAGTRDPDRRAAEWVLSIGGTVSLGVDNKPPLLIEKGASLPAGPFRLITIGLNENRKVTDDDLDRLSGLTELSALYLDDTRVTDAALAKVKHLTKLQVLMVNHYFAHIPRGPAITDAGLAHLQNMKDLHSLGLGGMRKVTDAGLAHLSELTKLVSVTLGYTGITDAGLAHLRKSSAAMSVLQVNGAQVSDNGLKHLAGMKNLRHLDLSQTQITGAGLKHLVCFELERLELNATAVSDAGLENMKRFPKLTHLHLGPAKVTDEGLRHLAGMKALQSLSLDAPAVTDAGLKHLMALDLRSLVLNHTAVTDAGLEHLKGFRNLKTLHLAGTKVTAEGVKNFHAVLPRCKIVN